MARISRAMRLRETEAPRRRSAVRMRGAHNPKVAGSNPAPAIEKTRWKQRVSLCSATSAAYGAGNKRVGAGKTIMAGLLIRELMVRGDVRRCMVVVPGSLVEQWQDELALKLGLDFEIITRETIEASRSGNPSPRRT
jgi:N12 class adenine-specific DNA methylase